MGSILINPWLPGQRASPQMKWWCLCCQFPQVTTQSTQRGPALFEPDVGKQASPTVSLSPTPPPHHSRCILLLRCCSAVTCHSCRSSDAPLDGSLPYFTACPPPLSSSPSLSLSPCGIALSIHSPLPLPSLCFHPSLLVWPTAPFRFAQGERVPCVCCLAACPLSSSPSFSPTSSFPLLSLFPLSSLAFHPCPILYSSSPPPLLHPSPRTSLCPRHSLHLLLITPPPSLSLCASIHTSFSVFLSPPPPPHLPPSLPTSLPSLLLGWAQEQ